MGVFGAVKTRTERLETRRVITGTTLRAVALSVLGVQASRRCATGSSVKKLCRNVLLKARPRVSDFATMDG